MVTKIVKRMQKVKTKISPAKQPNNEPQFTEEQVAEALQFKAKKLAVLLMASSLPDELKIAWLNLFEDMTAKQMDELLQLLEDDYLQNATQSIDDHFAREWEKRIAQYEDEEDKDIMRLKQQVEAIKRTSKELQ